MCGALQRAAVLHVRGEVLVRARVGLVRARVGLVLVVPVELGVAGTSSEAARVVGVAWLLLLLSFRPIVLWVWLEVGTVGAFVGDPLNLV